MHYFARTILIALLSATLLSACALARKLDEGRETDLSIDCWVVDPANPDGERVVERLDPSTCAERGGRVE